MLLFDYFRSTASFRVRIALNLKGIDYDVQEVHLVNQGGAQHSPEYQAINPQELVPSLKIGEETLTQSLAILEYLEEQYPNPPLLPKDPMARASVRAMAFSIACDIHPLNNLRVLQYLKNTLEVDDEQKLSWYHHWMHLGFSALESQLNNTERDPGVCFGDTLSLADVCLVAQVYNAMRFNLDMGSYPQIAEINEHCMTLEAFLRAAP